ncbi:hypothetical protein NBRC116583_16570 [Arenicella sp. 4NH20-0111]|uniref:VWA domain-containing protein n=1 Tax=Arenicella sp. 4NH20-0111 TaxID=3127648 RepID=UPI00310C282C
MKLQHKLLAAACAISFSNGPLIKPVQAGENLEAVTDSGTVIRNRTWANSAMPIDWSLNNAGAVNNNSQGAGTANIPINSLRNELLSAFNSWQSVGSSNLTFNNVADTATADVGCDLENIVTWSDTTQVFSASTIARGITTVYVGPAITLNAGNRTVPCSDGSASTNVSLPVADYPNGMSLQPGTILDMDMVWNSLNFDYVLTPNTTNNVVDVLAVSAHEIGHLFGLSHVSMAFTGNDRVTMFPFVTDTDVAAQNQQATLEEDDFRSATKDYAGTGAHPNGTAPFTTGTITGQVTMPNGDAVQGARVWFYDVGDTSQPVYETFTATQFDSQLSAGEYRLEAALPGDYFACIIPWSNAVPSVGPDDPARYTLSTVNGANHDSTAGWATECFPDYATGGTAPDFDEVDLIQPITVGSGSAVPNIDFVTGSQQTDISMVFDVSGSMNWASGEPGESKITALKNAATAFVDFLDLAGGSRVGMIEFSNTANDTTPAFGIQNLDAASIGTAHNAIQNLSAGGGTNIIDGVQQGVAQLTGLATPNPRQMLLLFSDGRHNTPFGSDLNDISAPIVSNDIRLHSIGFGTDLSSAVLADVALASGGSHAEDPSLSPLELSKHFLSIAASAADDTMLVDPRKDLKPGESNIVNFIANVGDRKLDVASIWVHDGHKPIVTTVTSPSGCKMELEKSMKGVDVRAGKTHTLARIALPFQCKDSLDKEGVWRIESMNVSNANELNDIIVFGKSDLRLMADVKSLDGRPLLVGKIFNGVNPVEKVRLYAELKMPATEKTNSENEDKRGSEANPEKEAKASIGNKRLVSDQFSVELNDFGSDGDLKAGDLIHSSLIKVERPGVYVARVVAKIGDRLHREALISFYVDENGVIAVPADQKSDQSKPMITVR